MILSGRSVVVCRATRQAGALIERLGDLGAEVVHVPLIDVLPPVDGGAELHDTLASSTASTWLALTSANGVDAVAAVLGRSPEPRVAVVGAATARRAEELGWTVDFVSPEASARRLGEALPVEPGDRVVAAVAELASDDLAMALRNRDAVVDVVTAYRTVSPEVAVSDQHRIAASDLVLVTAPSVINRLATVMDIDRLPALVAIGPTSAAAIEAVGLEVADRADVPSEDGLIDAAVRTLQA